MEPQRSQRARRRGRKRDHGIGKQFSALSEPSAVTDACGTAVQWNRRERGGEVRNETESSEIQSLRCPFWFYLVLAHRFVGVVGTVLVNQTLQAIDKPLHMEINQQANWKPPQLQVR